VSTFLVEKKKMNAGPLTIWHLQWTRLKTFQGLVAKLAEKGDFFLLVGKQVASGPCDWSLIRDMPGDSEEQRQLRVYALLHYGRKKTLKELHDILLPVDKALAEYVLNIKV